MYIYIYVYRYVCERLPGASSSPIVTKLRQSYPLVTGEEVIKFWKVKVGGELCALLSISS